MSAIAADQARLDLEDVIAGLLDAEERLRCAALRLTQRMRTIDEAEIVNEINAGRVAIETARRRMADRHPDRR